MDMYIFAEGLGIPEPNQYVEEYSMILLYLFFGVQLCLRVVRVEFKVCGEGGECTPTLVPRYSYKSPYI